MAACLLAAASAGAQTVTGTVRDSTSRLVIPGVVVELQDANGGPLGRTLTTASGTFTFASADLRAAQISLLRIGFRPRKVPVKVDSVSGASLEIPMVRLPTMLDRMDVVAGAKCEARANAAGQALLQQARAGLLATIVGREANPAKVVRISYERTYSVRPDTMMPVVRIDSASEATTTFRAARAGADLVAKGFTADSLGTGVYFAPDAEVLLDPDFEAGYCFYVVPERRGEIGLGFSPARSRRLGRIDVEGVLWIDEKERALRTLEYRYVGAGDEAERNGVGGSLTYQEMPNGAVIVSRWTLRLLKVRVDSQAYRSSRTPLGRIVPSEGGGIIVRAEWPDSTRWSIPLGTLEVAAVDGETGARLSGATIRVRNTNLAAKADANGVARFADVFPGRYAIDVPNPELDALGFVADQSLANAGILDSAVIRGSLVQADTVSLSMARTVDVFANRTAKHVAPRQTVRQYAEQRCRDPKRGTTTKRIVLGRAVYGSGRGVPEAQVRADQIKRHLTAGERGEFVICVPDDWTGPFKLTADDGTYRGESVVELGERLTTVRVVIRPVR